VDADFLSATAHDDWFKLRMSDDALNAQLERAEEQLKERKEALDAVYADKRQKLETGDDLAPGVLKIVKVYLAIRRRIQPGDKMAGRHGNKGVISVIMPVEDMPSVRCSKLTWAGLQKASAKKSARCSKSTRRLRKSGNFLKKSTIPSVNAMRT
jgi:hypothetical protein